MPSAHMLHVQRQCAYLEASRTQADLVRFNERRTLRRLGSVQGNALVSDNLRIDTSM